METSLAAITIDLDEITCYTQIHGLSSPQPDAARAVYQKALPRFERLLDELGIPATFFVVGSDLKDSSNRSIIKRISKQGHEIANHSANHLYDLTRHDEATISDEISLASKAIVETTGQNPVGFRAPGYTMSKTVFDILRAMDFRYDSSLFPCPAYYMAKSMAIAGIKIAGRKSQSILGNPFCLSAPAVPFHTGTPYWRKGNGILELPIGVTPLYTGRLPYIGTSLIMAGVNGSALLTRLMIGRPLINLELHGIELADADTDGLTFLRGHRPDLRYSLEHRENVLRKAVKVTQKSGYSFVTLAEAARYF